ncbi:hypothetical protein VE02_05686 [Pseudogymnoascus sp. 03VT05]|nr:hypothetical protein VE02_05686 [Pseudogymnoascus sp. 03VT05]
MASAAILQYPVTLPTTQTAVIASETGDFEISSNVPLPSLQPDEILIKTATVGLNPVDTKLVGDFVTPGCIFGFDCAGIVVAVGSSDVHKARGITVGDRVCGSASGMNKLKPLGGAFAEHNLCLWRMQAALGTAVASAAMALFWSLGIDPALFGKGGDNNTGDEAPKALVYGGSTCTGTMVIQLLRLCGFHVVTTCSPRNFELTKSFGAHETFDYKSSGCAANINAHCENALEYAVDCVAEDSTMKFCYAAIGRAVIQPDWILATSITGDASSWPAPYACEPEPRLLEMAGPVFEKTQQLLLEGKIRAHPVRVEEGGWHGLLNGVQIIRKGEVSGQKSVYKLS